MAGFLYVILVDELSISLMTSFEYVGQVVADPGGFVWVWC